ncbi:MAG: hypothetical protein U0R24_05115 [Solirubrobacterales bacterium]
MVLGRGRLDGDAAQRHLLGAEREVLEDHLGVAGPHLLLDEGVDDVTLVLGGERRLHIGEEGQRDRRIRVAEPLPELRDSGDQLLDVPGAGDHQILLAVLADRQRDQHGEDRDGEERQRGQRDPAARRRRRGWAFIPRILLVPRRLLRLHFAHQPVTAL